MFKVLLYTWVVLTIALVGIIATYTVRRGYALLQRRKHRDKGEQESNTQIEAETELESEAESAYGEADDLSIYSSDSHAVQAEGGETEVTEEAEEAEEAVPEQSAGEEQIDDQQGEQSLIQPTDQEEDSNENKTMMPEREDKISITVCETVVMTSGDTDSFLIEIPKAVDGAKNIGQGHSRDDIVRDKFEKHIEKLRYEAGVLKQRHDILGYEKKLVEGVTLLPNDKDFQKQLADLYFQQGKYKKAHSLLKKILTDAPQDHNALWQMGEISLEEHHSDDAYVYFQQAYTLCNDNPKYCFSLAQWYYDKEDLTQALPLMEKMVKLRPKNIDYLVSLSHIQHKMNLQEEAKQTLLRALELDPMNIALKKYLKAFDVA